MSVIHRYAYDRLYMPVDGYEWKTEVHTSIDGGKTFYYCGNGEYFRTEAEAAAWCRNQQSA